MTNEEKAREIASHYICDNEVMHYDHGDAIYEFETFGEETKDAALEMADWKDEQYKTDKEMLINKAWNFIRSRGNHFEHQTWEEIEEAFKNYME